jgi:hypothetical protein
MAMRTIVQVSRVDNKQVDTELVGAVTHAETKSS